MWVHLLAYMQWLVPCPDPIILDKAIHFGAKATAMHASFALDLLVAFHVKALGGSLPTHAQTHMYWPRRVPFPSCVLCGALDDQDHWCVCPALEDVVWNCGVVAFEQVERLLGK